MSGADEWQRRAGWTRGPSGRLDRRQLLTATAAAAAAPALFASTVCAQGSSAVHRFKVGAAEITVVSDGEMTLPLRFVLPGREQAEIEKLLGTAGQQPSAVTAQVNVALIKIGDHLILVDTGGGTDFMPTLGKLPDRLEAAGVKPEQITKVIFTHAHADHLWGVIDPLSGASMFETAQHLMTQAERDYWLRPGLETQLPEAFQMMAVGTQRRLKALAERIETRAPGSEIAPGVALVDTPGHTPGHVSVLVRSGSEQLLIGGDALTHPSASFAEPGWRWGPDMDPDRAITTRRMLLDRLATERTMLLGYHLPWPGTGRVERVGVSYRFEPIPLAPTRG